ncbi:MAG: L-2-amino-thiazoline-4-carboxylic acid hydrolase [Dehalococcoidia bacterium]|nr:L-2-amino-thiazoline-4-carboxylic acid hydrolase [Dehalococcoidia bacterium]
MSEKHETENYGYSEVEMGKRYKNWTEGLARQMVLLYRIGKEVGGEKFVNRLKEAYAKDGQKGAKMWMTLTGTGPDDYKDCMKLPKIQDMIDDGFANVWDGYIENSPQAFEKELKTCPVAKVWSKEPDLCAICVNESAVSMYTALNPKFKFKGFSKLLTRGDDSCRFRVEMEE